MKGALGLSVFKECEPLTPVSTGCPRKKETCRHRLCTAIVPFWFSTEHCLIVITSFWLSTDIIKVCPTADIFFISCLILQIVLVLFISILVMYVTYYFILLCYQTVLNQLFTLSFCLPISEPNLKNSSPHTQ